MRKAMMLAALLATAGCQKAGAIAGEGNRATDTLVSGAGALLLTPGEWEITTAAVPPPGAPGGPQTRTSTMTVSVEDAANPARIFGECQRGALRISGGHVQGNMPCHG